MSRSPPAGVKRALRSEVGFGCPVPGCGNPYLDYHHFDPPYAVEQHHRPEGMIALCAEHHRKADAGAFTAEQLVQFKLNRANAEIVRGSFDWLRRDLLVLAGGMIYHETYQIIRLDGRDVLWFSRDDDGYLRLNLEMLSLSPEPRAIIDGSNWMNIGAPRDLHSPPNGRKLEIIYESGDSLAVEFFELGSVEEAYKKYPSDVFRDLARISFPITAVEINLVVAGTGIELHPTGTTLLNRFNFKGGFMSRCGGAFNIDTGLPWRENTMPSQVPRFGRNLSCPCKSGQRYKACHGKLR
jgi:hypothetical protein